MKNAAAKYAAKESLRMRVFLSTISLVRRTVLRLINFTAMATGHAETPKTPSTS